MAPDKIYATNIAGTLYASNKPQEIFGEQYSEYIRKDALIEWAESMKRICKGSQYFEQAYQTVIKKLESL